MPRKFPVSQIQVFSWPFPQLRVGMCFTRHPAFEAVMLNIPFFLPSAAHDSQPWSDTLSNCPLSSRGRFAAGTSGKAPVPCKAAGIVGDLPAALLQKEAQLHVSGWIPVSKKWRTSCCFSHHGNCQQPRFEGTEESYIQQVCWEVTKLPVWVPGCLLW